MRQWIYVLKPARLGMLTEGSTPEEDEIVSRHFAYLKDLTEKGVMIPSVFSFKSMYKRLAPDAAIAMAHAAMESIENCGECGECVEKCPYDLPIPDLLKENLALYKEYVKRG